MSKKVITGTSNDSFVAKNMTTRKLFWEAVINTTGTVLSTNYADFDQVMLNITLKQAGRTTVLANAKLGVLTRFTSFEKGTFEAIHDPFSYLSASNVASSKYVHAGCIDLGEAINLNDDDELIVSITHGVNPWHGSIGSSSTSTINFQWREEIGVQKYIPVINVESVPSGQASFNRGLGDNVTALALISTAKTTLTDANAEYVTTQIRTDKQVLIDNLYQMINRRFFQFDVASLAASRYHCFYYEPNAEWDNLVLDLTLNPTNVTANVLFVCTRAMVFNSEIMANASNYTQKHIGRNRAKLTKQLAA